MKLDFTLLSRPASAPPAPTTRGQAGTAGTPAFMRLPAASARGDGPGTGGDKHACPTTQCIDAAAADHLGSEPCPPPSPPSPHAGNAGKATEINVSPVSPPVPGTAAMNDHRVGFEHEAFEERAGIMEFDGGMTRSDAEAAARILIANARRKHADD